MRMPANLPLKRAIVGVAIAGLLTAGGTALAQTLGVTSCGSSLRPAGRHLLCEDFI